MNTFAIFATDGLPRLAGILHDATGQIGAVTVKVVALNRLLRRGKATTLPVEAGEP